MSEPKPDGWVVKEPKYHQLNFHARKPNRYSDGWGWRYFPPSIINNKNISKNLKWEDEPVPVAIIPLDNLAVFRELVEAIDEMFASTNSKLDEWSPNITIEKVQKIKQALAKIKEVMPSE